MNSFHTNDETKTMKLVCPTCFEDLSNDVIYEIFDYLDGCQIYEVFSLLNTRFHHIFTSPYFRLKVNLPLMSKSSFSHRCDQLIRPNMDRIISLTLTHHWITDRFLHRFFMFAFVRLEALYLDGVPSDYLFWLLIDLPTLSRLVSLTIICTESWTNKDTVYEYIFRLPRLKYCKLKAPWDHDDSSFPDALNEEQKCQTIEYFIIDGPCQLHQLAAILTYMPRLKHLSYRTIYEQVAVRLRLPLQLTHVALKLLSISFNDFEMLFIGVLHKVQRLRVSTRIDENSIHAKQWEQLISRHMPNLRIFDLRYETSESIPASYNTTVQTLVDQFKSAFWRDRHWFFNLQYWIQHNSITDEEEYSAIFHSTNPYRRKHYELYQCDSNQIDVHSASHLTIAGQEVTDKCLIHFPNVTKLTLIENSVGKIDQFINNLNRIVPLFELTHLFIKGSGIITVGRLLGLLEVATNVKVLKLDDLQSFIDYPLSVEETDTTRSISKKNKIIKIIMYNACTLEHIHFFVDLCPHLQRLEVEIYEPQLELIIQLLLSNNAPNLFWLVVMNNFIKMEQIQAIIERDKLLHDYHIERLCVSSYLWW